MRDKFECVETLPVEVQEIVEKYSVIAMEEGLTYDECNDYVKELQAVGYTCEFGLDAEPYGLICLN